MPTTEGVAINHMIDTTSSVPPYEQLRRRIAAQIDAGELEVDSRLPTVRDLAQQAGLANNTIAKAYRELEAMRADTAEPSTVEELLAERLGPSIVILSYVTRRESLTCRHSSIWVGGVAG